MKRRLMAIPLIILILGAGVAGCQPADGGIDAGIKVGALAPDFTLQNLEGETVTLSSLRGSPVMLNFWASWCPPCRFEMPFIQEVFEKWQEQGLVILAINIRETPAVAKGFMESNGLSFPVVLDTSGVVTQRYAITAIPATFFIDKDGIIRVIKVGAFNNPAAIVSYLPKIMPKS